MCSFPFLLHQQHDSGLLDLATLPRQNKFCVSSLRVNILKEVKIRNMGGESGINYILQFSDNLANNKPWQQFGGNLCNEMEDKYQHLTITTSKKEKPKANQYLKVYYCSSSPVQHACTEVIQFMQ